jgi:hypothetical protein
MDAWVDGDIDRDDRTAFESHLNDCAACRIAVDLIQTQDAELRQLFEPQRVAAGRVADAVIARIRDAQTTTPHPQWQNWHSWIAPLLGVAVGFLLAVLVFQPWKNMRHDARNQSLEVAADEPIPGDEPAKPAAASLVLATGAVEVREPNAGDWKTVGNLPVFSCPTESTVRTAPNVRCELETPEGCVIRLDGKSEVVLKSSNTIEVKQGQIWCQAPKDAHLTVLAAAPAKTSSKGSSSYGTVSAFNDASCMMSCNSDNGAVRVMSAEGDVKVQCADDRQVLKRGENVSIVGGKIVKDTDLSDPLLDASWVHPLLTKKGHTNAELNSRVDLLLARIGRTKISTLYEQEIRGLGEFSALPLLRYVESPLSKGNAAQRQSAMRILSDIAPSWAIGDLIGILADEDEEVRVQAAQALHRLTGQSMGKQPEDWGKPWPECRETHARWQAWWNENRSRFPAPFDTRQTSGERPASGTRSDGCGCQISSNECSSCDYPAFTLQDRGLMPPARRMQWPSPPLDGPSWRRGSRVRRKWG